MSNRHLYAAGVSALTLLNGGGVAKAFLWGLATFKLLDALDWPALSPVQPETQAMVKELGARVARYAESIEQPE